MIRMFRESQFNQSIGDWDVRNVTSMEEMFWDNSNINQDLSRWCVSKIPNKPVDFDKNTPQWVLLKPVWGTCPAN